MKDQTVILLAVGVVAGAYFLLQNKKGVGVARGAMAPGYSLRIENPALQGQPGAGWQYFTNGTAIDPAGNYFLNGEMVWSPAQ